MNSEDITVKKLLAGLAPVSEDSTGVQVVGLGKEGYGIFVQGPDSAKITTFILEKVESLFNDVAAPANYDQSISTGPRFDA